MATYDEVMRALRLADQAGNADDARRLAEMARSMRSAQNAAPPSPQQRSAMEQGMVRPGEAGVATPATAEADPLNRFYMGLGDMPLGAAQLVMNALTDATGIAPETTQGLNDYIANREQSYQAVRDPQGSPSIAQQRYGEGGTYPLPGSAPFDWARMAGNVATGLPMAALGGESYVGAAFTGGLMGATVPQANGDFSWEQKLAETGLGTLGGLGGNALGRGLSRMISPNTNPEVQALMSRGVTPTPGQILGGAWNRTEQKLTSILGLGDAIASGRGAANREFNRAVYADVLDSIGGKVPAGLGREAIEDIHSQISREYDTLLPSLQFTPDAQLGADLNNIFANFGQRMAPDTAARMQREFRNFLALPRQKGTLTGEDFKRLESTLSSTQTRLASGTAEEQLYGEAVGDLLSAMRANLQRSNQGLLIQVGSQTMDAGERLAAVNLAYAKLKRLERAGSSVAAESGIFTPAQFLNAVKALDRSNDRTAFAQGNALMQDLADAGKNVLGNTVPDSGSPGRLAAALQGGIVATHPSLMIPGIIGASPYIGPGRSLAAALLASRPSWAPTAASYVERAIPGLVAAGGALPAAGN